MADNLPALRASRLPWHPVFEDYGIERTDWQALVEAVFPGAQSLDSIRLALSYCKRRNLDPFKRVIHIVPVWNSEERRYVDTIWPGIAELRTTAFRTQQYAGADETLFGDMVEGAWQDGNTTVKVVYPAWAQMTVYRLVGEQRVPVPGPKVYWMETYSAKGRSDVPNERWRRAPNQMLEKCAEAAALRKAFPEELGDEHSHEEVGALTRDVTPPPANESPTNTGNQALRTRLGIKEPQVAQDGPDADEAYGVEPPADETPEAQPQAAEAHPVDEPPDRSRVGARFSPAPPESAPVEAEIASSQDMLAAVLGPEETAKLDEQTLATEAEIEVVKPQRLPRGRGWDWPRYADELIAAGLRTPLDQLGRFRGANASMFDVLRNSDKEQWSRVNQQLAEYEREGT